MSGNYDQSIDKLIGNMFLAFGIVSLVLAVISIFIPGAGIVIAGISGFMAWMSIGKGLPFGAAAIILNFINIFFLSPAYMLAVGVEESLRTPDQANLFKIWAAVLFVQVAAVIIFIANFAIDQFLDSRRRSKRQESSLHKNRPETAGPCVGDQEIRVKQFATVVDEAEPVNEPNTVDIPKVTKVLIHKIHGGRKKDSKFWSPENGSTPSDDSSIPIEILPENVRSRKFRKDLDVFLYPLITLVIIIVVLIIARPDLFPFFEYHNIYNSIGESSSKNDNNSTFQQASIPKPAESAVPNRSRQPVNKERQSVERQIQPDPGRPNIPTEVSNIPQDIIAKPIHRISISGKVFSWRDREGKLFFSNTDFPLDNDTLQVQTEINTYHKVTRINIVGNKVFVPVTLGNNGREVKLNMLLDTGCSQTTIPFKYLDKISPTYIRTAASTLADGSKTFGKEAVVDFMRVGSKREDQVTVTGQKIAGSSNTGLLGFDFLKKNPFKIDFENNYIVWM
jgi:hypothetical protein